MWRDNLVEGDTEEFLCMLPAPSTAGLAIQYVPEEDSGKKWSLDRVKDVLDDLIDAGEAGKVEIGVPEFMVYMQQRLPGISEHYDMYNIERSLGTFLKEIVQAFEEDEAGNGDDDDWDDDEDSSDTDPGLDEDGLPEDLPDGVVRCLIAILGGEGVLDSQAKALDFIEANDPAIRDILVDAVSKTDEAVAYVTGLKLAKATEKKKIAKAVGTLIECEGVQVMRHDHEGLAYTEFQIRTAWEEEHRIKIVLHGDRVVFTGDSGTYILSNPENDADKAALGILPGASKS